MEFVSLDKVIGDISNFLENSNLTQKYNLESNYKLSQSGNKDDEYLDYEVSRMEAAKYLHQAFLNQSKPTLFSLHKVTGLPVKANEVDVNQMIGWLEYLSIASDRAIKTHDKRWFDKVCLNTGFDNNEIENLIRKNDIPYNFKDNSNQESGNDEQPSIATHDEPEQKYDAINKRGKGKAGVKVGADNPKSKQQGKQLDNDKDGKPKERQAYFCPIWERFGKPKGNNKIWIELKRLSGDDSVIKSVFKHDEFSFAYQEGTIEPLTKKTFQNDMWAIRKQN